MEYQHDIMFVTCLIPYGYRDRSVKIWSLIMLCYLWSNNYTKCECKQWHIFCFLKYSKVIIKEFLVYVKEGENWLN